MGCSHTKKKVIFVQVQDRCIIGFHFVRLTGSCYLILYHISLSSYDVSLLFLLVHNVSRCTYLESV